MITALVFDCFGVLTTDGWLPFKARYFEHDAQLFEQASDLNKQADAGLIDFASFVDQVADMAGMTSQSVRHAIERNVPNEPLFALIASLKSRYKIGVLSNASGNWLSDLFSSDQLAVFDAVSLSYETRVIKPDSLAYEAIAFRLGVPTEACLFIDDQERFCSGAIDAGMQAICYKNYKQLVVDLKRYGVEISRS